MPDNETILKARITALATLLAASQIIEGALWVALAATTPRAEFDAFRNDLAAAAKDLTADVAAEYERVTGEKMKAAA